MKVPGEIDIHFVVSAGLVWPQEVVSSDDHESWLLVFGSMLTKHFAGTRHMQFLSSCLNTPQMQYFCLFLVQLQHFLSWCCISVILGFASHVVRHSKVHVPALCNTIFTLCFSLLLVWLEETCQVQSATFLMTCAAIVYLSGNRDKQASRASLKGDDLGISFKTSRWD